MKKTLLIASDFLPFGGGIGTYLSMYVHLPKKEIVILAPYQKGVENFDNNIPPKIYRSRFLKVSGFARLLRFFIIPIIVSKIVLTEKIEAIHVGHVVFYSPIFLLVLELLHLKVVTITYGMEILAFKSIWVSRGLKNSSLVIAISNFTKKIVLQRFKIPEYKIAILFPGYDSGIYRENINVSDLKTKFVTGEKFVILTVARLVARKGHQTVLDSLVRLKEKGFDDFIYLIVGDGPEKLNLQKKIKKLNLENYVKLVGFVPNDQLAKFYNLCDVFVMTPFDSDKEDVEGFGIVYLEANACGKPVIGSKTGGVEDAIVDGQSGILIKPGDYENLAAAILKLANDKQFRHRLGQYGRERSLRFTLKNQVKNFAKILEKYSL